MNDQRRRHRVERAKTRCLDRIERCVGAGRLPREAVSAVDDLVAELDRVRALPDAELDDTQVGRKR